jgi:hypothetical protein
VALRTHLTVGLPLSELSITIHQLYAPTQVLLISPLVGSLFFLQSFYRADRPRVRGCGLPAVCQH